MAANTKYQPAPQRDSLDERYPQPPPSYEATATGPPRTEYDNVPDDFKVGLTSGSPHRWRSLKANGMKLQFGGTVAEGTLPIRMQFIRKVYSILYVPTLFPQYRWNQTDRGGGGC